VIERARRFLPRRYLPLVVLIPIVYALSPIFWLPISGRAYNYFQSKRSVPPWTEVAVVGIDEKTRSDLFGPPVFPLSRHTTDHAELVERMANSGARAIVFDLTLGPENFATPPVELAEAFEEAGNVYLVLSLEERRIVGESGERSSRIVGRLPHPVLVEASRGAFVVDVQADRDGVVRRYARDRRIDRLGLEALPERLAGRTFDEAVPIEFPSTETPLPVVSYADVVGGKDEALDALRGRIAFVGLVEDQSEDFVPVPRLQSIDQGTVGFGLPGVVVLAAITETLIRGAPLRDAGPMATLGWILLWSVFCVTALPRRRPALAALILLAILAAALVVTGVLHALVGVVFPAGLLLGALLFSGVNFLVSSYVETTKELHAEEVENERVRLEMETARRTQERLLPKELPRLSGYELWGVNISSLTVSGDYYDVIDRGEDRPLLIAIADVTGKGLPASLVMSQVHAALHSHALQETFDLSKTAANLNRLLFENTDAATFVTIFLVELDERTGLLRYVRAGHDYPILVSAAGETRYLEEGGIFVGVMPDVDLPVGEARIGKGDVLCLYTDGVTEARSGKDEEFQTGRLAESLVAGRAMSAAEIGQSVVQAVQRFTGLSRQADDLTLVIVKRTD
jgi:serine phosphatase RsbU (regulator of sigma subunit)/CHASE2 domain-containing sensor protein